MKGLKRLFIINILVIMLLIPTSQTFAMSNRASELISELKSMSDKVYRDYRDGKAWTYKSSNSNLKGTFESARKGNKQMNCSRYISWGLIKIGVLSSGQYLYKTSSKITYNSDNAKNKIHSKATVKNIESKGLTLKQAINKGEVKAGDIVCYKSHMNVYTGKAKGDIMACDGGSANTNTTFNNTGNSNMKDGAKYNKKLYRKTAYVNAKVTRVIRLKAKK